MEEHPEPITSFERIVTSPNIGETIAQIPTLWREKMQNDSAIANAHLNTQAAAARRATNGLLVTTIIMAVIVIGPTTLLTWNGKLSPDAAAFLFGTVVGAAFTFLRDFFPRVN